MSRVVIKERTGKHLFEYMVRAMISTKEANNWALEEFVYIDNQSLDVTKISQLTDRAYLTLTSRVFASETPAYIQENNIEIKVKDYVIPKKKLSRDFVTEMQAYQQQKRGDTVALLKYCITKFYDVSLEELEAKPYYIASYLVNKINFFLEGLSNTQNEFDIDDVWTQSPQETTR